MNTQLENQETKIHSWFQNLNPVAVLRLAMCCAGWEQVFWPLWMIIEHDRLKTSRVSALPSGISSQKTTLRNGE